MTNPNDPIPPNQTYSNSSPSSNQFTTYAPLVQSFVKQYSCSYFLHHSDSTSLVLVSDLLTKSNYSSWSQSMTLSFTVKNKMGFIDGTLPKPIGDLQNSWIICNSVVTTWIFNALSKKIAASVNFSDSTREIWLDLQQRYQSKKYPCIFQFHRELSNLVQDQLSVIAYFTKLKTAWNELASYQPICSCGRCTCGGVKELLDYFQIEHVMEFLMGLNNSFSQIRTCLLLTGPEPTIQ
ncbi:uncharacterized protein LOC120067409 [Benincasa hispida]|uniref:uncharacterized protein LOC120067409 n=1 Tax=Benincasa hispida TaxID=102211 RepID=UPI001902B0FF|nr:uncharacterized protein LOC120067409 [Benincasa hispida]